MAANPEEPETGDLLLGAAFSSRHRRRVAAPPPAVRRAMDEVTFGDMRLGFMLMTVRAMPGVVVAEARRRRGGRANPGGTVGGGPLGDGRVDGVGRRVPLSGAGSRTMTEVFAGLGFVGLRDDDQGLAFGAVARFWQVRPARAPGVTDAASFRAFDAPGWAKAVTTLTVVPDGTGSLLTTTTAVAGTDDTARRAFGRYWTIIRVPSGLIRREWLAAIARRAERAAVPR